MSIKEFNFDSHDIIFSQQQRLHEMVQGTAEAN